MRKYLSFLIVAVMVVAVAMSSCEGEQGPPGEQGPAGPQGPIGPQGPAVTITINEDGFWVINGTVTTVKAVGTTPVITINDDGYWVINGVATTVKATGEQGPIATVIINDDGYWVINGVVTTVKATGPAGAPGAPGAPGETPTITISDDGYWVINGVKTDVKATYSDDGGGNPLGSTELVVATMPAKTSYNVGEAFSATGLVIGVKYNDALIPMNQFILMWNNAVLNNGNTAITAETGDKTVEVVDIVGRTTSFEITVVNPACEICGEYPCVCEPEEVEGELDKTLFKRWNPEGIPYLVAASWNIENLWDNNKASGHFGNSTPGFLFNAPAASLPNSFTFEIGQLAKIRSMKLYSRQDLTSQIYANNHPKRITIWGSPTDEVNADFETWLYLGEFECLKPSGTTLTGGTTPEEDLEYLRDGMEFIATDNTDVPVRYLRFHVLETWLTGGSNVALMEIDIFGLYMQKPGN